MTRRARNKAGELLEEPFSRQVEGLADFYGWRGYHTHDSRRSPAGFPDWVFVRDAELLFVELKTDTGRLKPAQRAWLAALERMAEAVAATNTVAELWANETGRAGDAEGLVALDKLLPADAPVDAEFAWPALEVHVWRPRDWNTLHERLARGRVVHTPLP